MNHYVSQLHEIVIDVTNTLPPPPKIWDSTVFARISRLQARTRGSVGEKIVDRWFSRVLGYTVTRSGTSQADRRVEGKLIEIKFSMLGQNNGYKFNQIRRQTYDFLVLFGVMPDDAHCWIVPKQEALRRWVGQHGGKTSKETSALEFPVAKPLEWLAPYGGSLEKAIMVALEYFGDPEQLYLKF